MRILHVVAFVGRRSGGLGPTALGLAHAQQTLGCEATVWCLDSPTEATQAVCEWNTDVRVVTTPVVGPAMVGFSPVAERMACSDTGARFDILHQHGIWMANSRITNLWRGAFQRPTVISPHGTLNEYAWRRSRWKKWLAWQGYEGRNLRLASCLHTAETDVLNFRMRGLRNPIASIPNGISSEWLSSIGDAERFRQQYAIPPGRRLLLFLSRLHPIKGLPLLFEALASMHQSIGDWCLVVAGPDEVGHRRELELLSERLQIGDCVQFVGPLSGVDKRDAFAAADLFVLPTHTENFGIVVVEALGAGVPVLTTHGAPWQELQTNRCGWWVDVSARAIQGALQNAVQQSKGELAAMGQRGKILVSQKYTWEQAAWKSFQLYDWLLQRGKRPDFVTID